MPVAALCFEHFGTSFLFMIQGILLLAAASLECFIRIEEKLTQTRLTQLKHYIGDIQEGFSYLKSEPGLVGIYCYFFFTMFCYQGIATIIIPFFESHPVLTVTSYSLLLSVETFARFLSGLFNYNIKLPTSKKYHIATFAYFFYEIVDALLMVVAFPVMIIFRFLLGFIGTTSANIRISAIQSYLPSEKRGRINSISSLLAFAGIFCGSLLSGILGEYLPYQAIGLLYGAIGSAAVYFFIMRNKTHIAKLYNREI